MSTATSSMATAVGSPGAVGLPLISVVIPTRNRAAILPHLLTALSKQVYPANRVEAILVDNASTDGTPALVAAWQAALPFPLRYIRQENRGPAAARNRGAAHARGKILAFTDSDCIPEPGWLRAAARDIAAGAGLVCGPIRPLRQEGAPGLLAAQLPASDADNGLYPTANLVVRRDRFDAVGGFNEGLGLHAWGELVAGEDADLAWRLRRRGARAHFDPSVEVGHLATRLTPRELLLRPTRAQVIPRLVRTIPELRRTFLFGGTFVSPSRPLYYLALAGALTAAGTRRPAWLLALVPWLAYQSRGTTVSLVRKGRFGRGVAWLALVAWFDTLTTAALLSGDIRARRLVL